MPDGNTFPLCLDLDGTLVRADTLHESIVALLRRQPSLLLHWPSWLRRGPAGFKRSLAERFRPDASLLPYDPAVLALARTARSEGRRVVLATGADALIANDVAKHLGLFDEVLASDGSENLTGPAKAKCLVARFGERGFAYAGNHAADLAVWAHAAEAHVVSARSALARRASRVCGVVHHVIPTRRPAAWIRALRPHQWSKNALVFVPVITSHRLLEGPVLARGMAAFAAFSLLASAAYLINDILDLEADRRHPEKCRRPLAGGAIAMAPAAGLAAAALVCGLLIGWFVSPSLSLVLAGYFALVQAYSLHLKTVLLVDVVCLAALYTLRLFAGEAATGIVLSNWLLGFSLFVFLSLALAKRYAETRTLATTELVNRRGYYRSDSEPIMVLGLACAVIATLVFALYLSSADISRLYASPRLLWLACPLFLYWLSRFWFFAHRGRLLADPVVFALRDPVSWLSGLLLALLLTLASFR